MGLVGQRNRECGLVSDDSCGHADSSVVLRWFGNRERVGSAFYPRSNHHRFHDDDHYYHYNNNPVGIHCVGRWDLSPFRFGQNLCDFLQLDRRDILDFEVPGIMYG